jgi:hypothetical protein
MYRAPKNSHRECRRFSLTGRQHPMRRQGEAHRDSPGSLDHGMPRTDFLGTCEILVSPDLRDGAREIGSKTKDGAHLSEVAKNKLSTGIAERRKRSDAKRPSGSHIASYYRRSWDTIPRDPVEGRGQLGRRINQGDTPSGLSAATRSQRNPGGSSRAWGCTVSWRGRRGTNRMR